VNSFHLLEQKKAGISIEFSALCNSPPWLRQNAQKMFFVAHLIEFWIILELKEPSNHAHQREAHAIFIVIVFSCNKVYAWERINSLSNIA